MYSCPGKQKPGLLIAKNIAKVTNICESCNRKEFRYRIINHEIVISAGKEMLRFIQLISEAFFVAIKTTVKKRSYLYFLLPLRKRVAAVTFRADLSVITFIG